MMVVMVIEETTNYLVVVELVTFKDSSNSAWFCVGVVLPAEPDNGPAPAHACLFLHAFLHFSFLHVSRTMKFQM